MRTFKEELQHLENEFITAKEKLRLRYAASELTDIDISEIFVNEFKGVFTISFGRRTKMTHAQVQSILYDYPVNGDNYEMKFAETGKNFVTDSPVVVKWCNAKAYENDGYHIEYMSGKLKIEINVPDDHFKTHARTYTRDGEHKGFGRYEQVKNKVVDLYKVQTYYGDHKVLYFVGNQDEHKAYLNYVFTGEYTKI